MPRPSNSSLFYQLKNIGWGDQIIKLLTMALLPLLCYFVPLIFSSAPNSETFSAYVPPLMWVTKFHTHTNVTQNYISIFLNLYIFDSKLEDKRYFTERYHAFRDFNLFLISSWIELCFVRSVPKYLNSSILSMELLLFFILWLLSLLWSRYLTIPKRQDPAITQLKKHEISRRFGLRVSVYNRWQPVCKWKYSLYRYIEMTLWKNIRFPTVIGVLFSWWVI